LPTVGITPTWAQETKGSEKAKRPKQRRMPALARRKKDVNSLADGLKAAEAQGKPISGKFEIEDGKLRCRSHNEGRKYSEVIVDHRRQDPPGGAITEKEDLAGQETGRGWPRRKCR
jgi:hypothetical protein